MATNLKPAIYSHLSGKASITALVSTRIYPQQAPQGAALPYIVYNVIGGEQPQHMESAVGRAMALVQFDCWADTPLAAENVKEALRMVLDGMVAGTMGTVNVRSVMRDPGPDQAIPPSDGKSRGKARATDQYRIWYAIDVPTFA